MKGLVEKQEQPTIGDRLLLARALEESRQVEEAKEQFIKVLKEGETSAALLLYIDFLNRNEQTDDAGATLARLETLDPENVRLLGLKIEWLMASHRASEIEETIDRGLAARVAAAKSDEQRAALDRYAAELLTRARLYDPAEKKLREAVRLVPASYETLALWLVERDRLNDALGLCLEKTSGEGLARQATTLVRVLTIAAARSVAAGPAQAKAEATIADALKLLPARGSAAAPKESGRPTDEEVLSLALETGVLRLMQGRNDEALALYEVALKIEPRNAVVLNNRAVVLSEMPGRAADALNDIDQALATVPNSVELLDSKALVLIGIGNFEESRAILERLCQTHRRNARYRLHLAFALHSLADRKSAREQLDQALRDGLEREILTPSERRYQEEISASGKAAERDGPVRRLPE
jgi:tetratricopeptide (TPR) repeat protein